MNQHNFSAHIIRTLICFCLSSFTGLYAQDQTDDERCGTVLYNDKVYIKTGINPLEKKESFERWINAKKETLQRTLRTQDTEQDVMVLQIPVVVHVIHRGEAVGEGSNIPLEQIEDQIRILNEDFRRLNADRTSTLPIFEPVAADMMIEFVLARQSPDGFATDGVTRTEGTQASYGINSANTLSNLSYWPAEDYLNIWVVPLGNSLLGFAQFPVSDLEGLEDSPNNRLTDGVVIDFRYFGSTGNAVSSSLGRTTTHEVGHFLGLRHIWGDGDCSADDFVEDTPPQESEYEGCPVAPESCGSPDMYQNYMDYTNDNCMNLFTFGQRERMQIVLLNSPRRASLLTSPALETPVIADNDAGIERIVSPRESECSTQITPRLEVYNAGENALNSVSIQFFLQGNLIEELQANPTLATGESTTLEFSTLELGENSNRFEISFQITQVNGVEDENAQNDVRNISFIIPQSGTLPLSENFENFDENSLLNTGYIRNPDELITWTLTQAPGFDGADNQTLFLNYFDYESGLGERDYLYTPVYDLSGLRSAQLSFRYAYAPYEEDGEVSEDGLIVGISTDCGATIEEVLFEATGDALGTMPPISTNFVPQSRAEWRQVEFSLDAYRGQPNVQLVFIGINDYGNNLYLDDIQLRVEEERELDIAITDIQAPALLSCSTTPIPSIVVTNQGLTTVNSFQVSYQIDNDSPTTFEYNAFPLNPGESREFTFEQQNLSVGYHTLTVTVSDPNRSSDEQPDDNQRTYNFYVDDTRDVIPLVQEFNDVVLADVLAGDTDNAENAWLVVNPDGEQRWQLTEALGNGNNNVSAFIPLYDYQNIGAQDLLVSPTLDFSNTEEASVFFKVSYALLSESYADTLRLIVSTDCGQTYETVYERAGADLAITTSTEAWTPQQESDWRQEFVNLSDYAGITDVRVAFEVVNAYGNNLYLDDIEFYTSADDQPVAQRLQENTYRVFPNPYNATSSIDNDGTVKIAFNLRERDDVNIILLDTKGRLLSNQHFPYTLNQTYRFDLSTLPTGMYLIKVMGRSLNTTSKLLKQ